MKNHLTPLQQMEKTICAIRLYSPNVEVASKRHISRPNEEPPISEKLTDDKRHLMKTINWLRYENTRNEANIWIRPMPSKAHPWLLLDDLNSELSHKISRKYASLLIETSSGNFQCRLLTDRPLDFKQRSRVQSELVKLLNLSGGQADRGSTAGDKWGRLPGFRNRKPGRDCWTNLVMDTTMTAPKFDPTPFLFPQGGACALSASSPEQPRSPVHPETRSSATSESEAEFGWVLSRLRFFQSKGFDLGREIVRLQQLLERQAEERGKRNPRDYSRRTILAVRRMLGV